MKCKTPGCNVECRYVRANKTVDKLTGEHNHLLNIVQVSKLLKFSFENKDYCIWAHSGEFDLFSRKSCPAMSLPQVSLSLPQVSPSLKSLSLLPSLKSLSPSLRSLSLSSLSHSPSLKFLSLPLSPSSAFCCTH